VTEDKPVDKRKLARELLIQAKFFRVSATVFLIMGILVSAVIYFKKIDGDVMEALHNPLLVVSLIIPFLPAAVLAKRADKSHKKLKALVDSLTEGDSLKK
jgi:hypothetical protein